MNCTMCQTKCMGFYADLLRGLNESYGEGRPFPHYTALARHCDLQPAQVSRYKEGKSSASLVVVGKILDGIGAKLVFPWDDLATTGTANEKILQEEITKLTRELDEKNRTLLRMEGRIEELREQLAKARAENK